MREYMGELKVEWLVNVLPTRDDLRLLGVFPISLSPCRDGWGTVVAVDRRGTFVFLDTDDGREDTIEIPLEALEEFAHNILEYAIQKRLEQG